MVFNFDRFVLLCSSDGQIIVRESPHYYVDNKQKYGKNKDYVVKWEKLVHMQATRQDEHPGLPNL